MQQGSSIKPVVARAEGWFAVFGRIGVMPGMYGGGAAEDETQEKALQGSDSLQKMYSASYPVRIYGDAEQKSECADVQSLTERRLPFTYTEY